MERCNQPRREVRNHQAAGSARGHEIQPPAIMKDLLYLAPKWALGLFLNVIPTLAISKMRVTSSLNLSLYCICLSLENTELVEDKGRAIIPSFHNNSILYSMASMCHRLSQEGQKSCSNLAPSDLSTIISLSELCPSGLFSLPPTAYFLLNTVIVLTASSA